MRLHHQRLMFVDKMTSSSDSQPSRLYGSAHRSHPKSNLSLPIEDICQSRLLMIRDARRNNKQQPPGALKLRGFSHLVTLILAITYCARNIHCQTIKSTEKVTESSLSSPPDNPTTTSSSVASTWLNEETAASALNINAAVKMKPVNFTLVDEVFEAALNEDEVVKRWRNMDGQLQDGMKSILKMVFPLIVSISQDAKVSGDCSGGILKWILSLRNLRSWAVKMLDATGKPTSGILEGSLTMFGNYKQCLSIRAPDEDEIEVTENFVEYFRGQFCVLHIKPWMPVKTQFYNLNSTIEPLLRKNYKYYEKTLYDELAELAIAFNFLDIRMDLCVPSTCTVADIQRVAELISKKVEMRAKVMRCDIASRDMNRFQYLDSISCYWLIVPGFLVLISLLSTIVVALKVRKTSCKRLVGILKCLSISETLKDRLMPPSRLENAVSGELPDQLQDSTVSSSVSIYEPTPLALYGLRSLFVLWFIVVQMTVELKYQYLRESLTLRSMIINYWPFQIIVNSILLFDSLILITAFTYGYTCLESTLKDLIIYISDKYIRLVIPIIALIAITIVTPILAIESPVWRNFVEEQSAVCKSTGHINVFFLQNFISYDKICLPHSWLFCVELQLIILSIPLVLLLKRSFFSTEDLVIINLNTIEEEEKKHGGSVCIFRIALCQLIKTKAGLLSVLFLIVGALVNIFTVYTYQLPPSWFYTFPDISQKNNYFGVHLIKTWTHLSSFLIGLLAGHLCRSIRQLHNLRLLKARQTIQQIPPAQNFSTSCHISQFDLQQSNGSTSTIISRATGSSKTDLTSTIEDQSECRKSWKNQSIRSLTSISSLIVALVSMTAITFSTHSWSTHETPSTFVAAIYDATSRIVWSLALAVITFQLSLPDAADHYKLTIRLLSHPICTFLGRLSFLAYLIAPYVNNFIFAVEEQPLFPSLFLIFHIIVGNIIITYVISFVLAIIIEQPSRRLFGQFVKIRGFCKHSSSMSVFVGRVDKL